MWSVVLDLWSYKLLNNNNDGLLFLLILMIKCVRINASCTPTCTCAYLSFFPRTHENWVQHPMDACARTHVFPCTHMLVCTKHKCWMQILKDVTNLMLAPSAFRFSLQETRNSRKVLIWTWSYAQPCCLSRGKQRVAPEVNLRECTLSDSVYQTWVYVLNANKARTHSGFETQRRRHQKSKTGVPVAPK